MSVVSGPLLVVCSFALLRDHNRIREFERIRKFEKYRRFERYSGAQKTANNGQRTTDQSKIYLLTSNLAKRACLLLVLVIIAFYFYGLGHLPLLGPDEPRYAQVAREMFLRRDLITPTLAGHTWFEKPVLLYWLMKTAFALFGISETTARLGPAFCGVLTLLATYLAGKRVAALSGDPALRGLGFWSALVLATMPGIIVFSRAATFDIVITMSLTWALSLFFLAEIEVNDKRRRWLLAGFYIFIGVSLLAKGLIGIVLPLGIVVLYQLLRRRISRRELVLSLSWGLPLSLVVAAVWYGPVIAHHGWSFIDEFFIQHHFARYVSNKYGHPQPVFYYLLVIFPLALPWLVLTIDGLRRSRHWHWRGKSATDKFRVFTFAWLVVPLLFFSFSGSKLPGYILPILPALALLAGERLTRIIAGGYSFSIIRIMAATLILFAVVAIVFAGISSSLSAGCAVLIVTPLVVAAVLVFLFLKHKRFSAIAIAMSIVLSFVFALNCGGREFVPTQTTKYLLDRATERGYGSARVYFLHEVDRGAEFYAAGRVAYDAAGQPIKFEGAGEILSAAGPIQEPLLVIVPLRYVYQLTGLKDVKAEVISDNGELAIVGLRRK